MMRSGNEGWGGDHGWRVAGAGLLTALLLLTGACTGSPTDTIDDAAATVEDAELSVEFGDLVEDLGLTEEQMEAIQAVAEEYRGRSREPGMLWYVAADLEDILTGDQIAAIGAAVQERGTGAGGRRSGFQGRRAGEGEERGARVWGPGGPHGPDLDLTDEQRAEIEAIRESFRPRFTAIRDAVRDGSLTREDAREQIRALRAEAEERIAGVLTADQLADLEAWKSEREEHRTEARERREEWRAGIEERREAERSAMIAVLGLTAEQVTALEALREAARTADRPADPEEMRSVREARHAAVMEILDADQEEIWILHSALRGSLARRAAGRRGGLRQGAGFGSDGSGDGTGFRRRGSRGA